MNSNPVTLFKTALMHRTHSSCRNASENFASPRSLSFSRISNSEVNPPSSKNSVSHFFEQPSSFLIKLAYVLSEGIRTNLMNNSGSISFKSVSSSRVSWPSVCSLISNPPALHNFFQFTDIAVVSVSGSLLYDSDQRITIDRQGLSRVNFDVFFSFSTHDLRGCL